MSTGLSPLPGAKFVANVSNEQVEHFRVNGFLHIDRITTDEEVEWLRDLYDRIFERKAEGGVTGGYFDLARPYDSEGEDLLPQVLFPERQFPELLETVYLWNARRIASKLLGVDTDALESWGHMIYKPPRRGHETPWHQDEAYWSPDYDYRALGVWMPLDDATVESGCLQFLPGSHTSRVLTHKHIHDDPNVHGLFTEEANPAGAVACPIPAGGATFHHCRILHYAGPNRTDRPRRAYANEFQTPPVRRRTPEERPWVREQEEAFARRKVFQEGT